MIAVERVGRLHLLTDESLQSRFSHVQLARLGALGGGDAIQYREKRPTKGAERLIVAREIVRVLEGGSARLIVNDRVDVAIGCRAGGVHLGREDGDPLAARRRLGEAAVIGVTANGLEEALGAAKGPADYLGVGPVFGTTSKRNPAAMLGLDGLRKIVSRVELPVVAIGGIEHDNLIPVLETGVHGVAVLSAFACAAEPGRAAARFSELIRAYHGGRPEGT